MNGFIFIFLAILVFDILFIFCVLYIGKQKREIGLLKEELKSLNGKIKKVERAKTDFLSMASHQLRSPLTVVRIGIGGLLDGTFGKLANKRQSEALNKMLSSSSRLIHIIDEYLDISRIELGKMKFSFVEQDLCQLVDEIVEEYQLRAEGKKIKLTFSDKDKKHRANFDEDKLRDVISNIIDNAIKYTEKGSVDVVCQKVGDNLQVLVKDTGIGMKKDEILIIFDKFKRVGVSNRRRKSEPAEGSGLGLYVAKMFVERHGGKIWAKSQGLNKGSTFTFIIPIKGTDGEEDIDGD